VSLYHEVAGDSDAVVLLHEGICDSGMWDPQWAELVGRYRVVRLDFPGFGRSELRPGRVCLGEDVLDLLGELGIDRATFVGASLGGRVALELALARPELVRALVLVGSGMLGHEWSDAVQAYAVEEEVAIERGDLDAAVEANLRMWVDGPHRTPEEVERNLRNAVGAMQRQAYLQSLPIDGQVEEAALVPDLVSRLSEIRCPVLVLVGELDVDDIHKVADRLRTEIAGARYASIPATAHVPNMERPAVFNELVLNFLAGAG
jgi:pimeloyl-ACP methyl ester carboxylesterase